MFKLADSGDMFVDYDGMISLEQGHIAGDSFSVQEAPVRWEKGKIHYENTERKGIIIDVDGRLTGQKIAVDIPEPLIKIREPDLALDGKVLVTIDEEVTVDAGAGFSLQHTTFSMPPLQVRDLNSGKPTEPASVKMFGTLDKRAPLEISGTVAPFAENLAMNMKIKLKNYPLAHLSAYTVQSVGVALASGQLQLESNINISDNQLDMENDLLLKKLETRTISSELAKKLDNQLPLPLNSALSLLRDNDDNISLDVPLKGPLDELDVGISDILITALGKAVVPAASGYLMYTLGPYGALAWVGMKVGEKILQVRLPPVEFTAKESEIPDNVKDYFDPLAKILQDKPDADLQLCPKSSAWEFISESKKKKLKEKELKLNDRDKEKLMKLGQERALKIKDYLMQNYSIDKDRLLICITEIETKKSARPRVEIHM